MRQVGALAVGVGLVIGTLGACGSDDEPGADADVTVLAEDSLEFDQSEYTVPAGEMTIGYENSGSTTHTLLIEGVDEDDFRLRVTSRGDTDAGTVDLEPGTYRIYCDVPGHEDMEATLIVE